MGIDIQSKSSSAKFNKKQTADLSVTSTSESNADYNIDDISEYYSKPISEYSNTKYSDLDNIYINKLRNLMVDIQNKLCEKNNCYYDIYTNYFNGKTFDDMLDDNYELSLLTDLDLVTKLCTERGIDIPPEQVMEEINKIVIIKKHI